jgi:hypothetical protein
LRSNVSRIKSSIASEADENFNVEGLLWKVKFPAILFIDGSSEFGSEELFGLALERVWALIIFFALIGSAA